MVKCSWEGHVHIPVWTTPAALALCTVSCLFACWRQKERLKKKKGPVRIAEVQRASL